jgi:hypothetical protein
MLINCSLQVGCFYTSSSTVVRLQSHCWAGLLLLLLLLLQVLDIATGKPLLAQPVENCAGGLTWWGYDSSTLLYTAEVRHKTSAAMVAARTVHT